MELSTGTKCNGLDTYTIDYFYGNKIINSISSSIVMVKILTDISMVIWIFIMDFKNIGV